MRQPVGSVHGHAFDKDGGGYIVAAVDLGQYFIEQITALNLF